MPRKSIFKIINHASKKWQDGADKHGGLDKAMSSQLNKWFSEKEEINKEVPNEPVVRFILNPDDSGRQLSGARLIEVDANGPARENQEMEEVVGPNANASDSEYHQESLLEEARLREGKTGSLNKQDLSKNNLVDFIFSPQCSSEDAIKSEILTYLSSNSDVSQQDFSEWFAGGDLGKDPVFCDQYDSYVMSLQGNIAE